MAIHRLVPDDEAAAYRGIPVLTFHVGDPLPLHRSPFRYAVHVGPDLARYLLTFNVENNRSLKPRKIKSFATDMAAGRWQFSPHALVFSVSGWMTNGQNTLTAIIEAGVMQWLVLDFGWPDELINVLDRGTPKNAADSLRHEGLPNPAALAAIFARVWQYDRLVGMSRSFSGYDNPSSPEILESIARDVDTWENSARAGKRVYARLDKGASPSLWGAIHYVIGRDSSSDRADAFIDEVADGTGSPGSATRVLAEWFRRRPVSVTKTGDDREPMELMIRAFNAGNRSFAFPKQKGFVLSRVKPA